MQLTVPLASAAIIVVIEAISNRNVADALQKNTMLDMLIIIRNPKAIEVEVVVVAIVVAVVVDEIHLSVSAMENQATTAKHSVPYLAALHTAIRQLLISQYERSMESGSRIVVRHTICIMTHHIQGIHTAEAQALHWQYQRWTSCCGNRHRPGYG